jgi:hypothetical protein
MQVPIRALMDTITVDPGYDTGIALWLGNYRPLYTILSTDRERETVDKIYDISTQFACYLQNFKPKTMIIEGVNLWGGSAASQAGTSKGYTFNLAYLVGSIITRAMDAQIDVKIVYVSDTTVDNVKFKGWKGNLDNKALRKRIERINEQIYPEHAQEAVGIGFSEMGIL